MRGSFTAELLKLRKRPAVWVLVGVWVTLSMAFGYLFPYLAYATSPSQPEPGSAPPERILADILPDRLIPNLIGGFPMFGGATVLILGVLLTGSEYGWNTLKTIMTQRPRRLSLLGGKVGVLAAVVLGLVVVTFALGGVLSAVVAAAESRPMDWPGAADLLRGVAAGWLILFTWGLFGLMFGVLFQGPALAVGLGLVWALVIENLVRGLAELLGAFDAIQKALPGVNAGSLVAALGSVPQGEDQGTPGVVAAVGGTQAVVVLCCYLVAFVAVSGVLLRRRDVT